MCQASAHLEIHLRPSPYLDGKSIPLQCTEAQKAQAELNQLELPRLCLKKLSLKLVSQDKRLALNALSKHFCTWASTQQGGFASQCAIELGVLQFLLPGTPLPPAWLKGHFLLLPHLEDLGMGDYYCYYCYHYDYDYYDSQYYILTLIIDILWRLFLLLDPRLRPVMVFCRVAVLGLLELWALPGLSHLIQKIP